jgi:hypothetical protein
MIDLKVSISERFKEKLSERFNLKNAELDAEKYKFRIHGYCPLCQEFMHRKEQLCEYCSFDKFKKDAIVPGCWEWIKSVLKEYPEFYTTLYDVNWDKSNDEKARKQLKLLCEKAKTLITWVED